MLNKNKWKLIRSSAFILLPLLASFILKERVESSVKGAWHFSWLLPVTLVIINVVLHLLTMRENKRVGQNQKIVNITFWILPVLSIYMSAIFMALSLGWDFNVGAVVKIMIGASLIAIGNYMPKSVRNRTFGVKIKWTLANDDNWVATHRFAGKLWVVCGVLMLVLAFLPEKILIASIIISVLVAIVPPIVYSYCYYKKQIASGTATAEDFASYPGGKMDKKTGVIAIVISFVLLVLVAVLMFVGSIDFTVGDEELTINTTFGGKMVLDYDDIVSVEYVEEQVSGSRVSGFASARLLYGWFRNNELGNYTRYTYADGDAGIIIRTSDGIIVIADESVEATHELYLNILEKKG